MVVCDRAFAVGGGNLAAYFGHSFNNLEIMRILVFQTAHKPAAKAAYFLGVKA